MTEEKDTKVVPWKWCSEGKKVKNIFKKNITNAIVLIYYVIADPKIGE